MRLVRGGGGGGGVEKKKGKTAISDEIHLWMVLNVALNLCIIKNYIVASHLIQNTDPV